MNHKEPQDRDRHQQASDSQQTNGISANIFADNNQIDSANQVFVPRLTPEDLYQNVYQHTVAAICIVEVLAQGEYRYLDFNPRCADWLGQAIASLKGKSPQEILATPEAENTIKIYDRCVRSQQVIDYEHCLEQNSKLICWLTILNPLMGNDGIVHSLISTSVKIEREQPIATPNTFPVSREQIQQALRSERLVRSITKAIRDTLDEKQVLLAATKSLGEELALDCCQIELYKHHHTITEVICEYPIVLPDKQGIHRQVADFLELYQPLLNKYSIHFVDWQPTVGYRQQRVTRLACPIFDDRGILGNIWLMRPKESCFEPWEIQLVEQIADQCAIAIRQARLYEAEQIQVQELEKLNLVKDDFLKTISHELRTPMSRLRLAISTLENLLAVEIDEHTSPKIDKVMEIFHTSFRKQNQLIDDLLTLCYVDVASKPDLWQAIELKTWIPQIVKTFSVHEERKLELELNLQSELSLFYTDPKMLKRVIDELLKNAYKYTPAEGAIAITTEQTDTQLSINITNTGVEIPLEEQERIFDKFYRIPNNDPWQHGGTGIGLALVKKLVELLEGEITVSSENQTTTFSLVFGLN